MLQMDMTAWVKTGTVESVGVIQDFVDPGLTDFVYQLVEKYRTSYFVLRPDAELITIQFLFLRSRLSAHTLVLTIRASAKPVINLPSREFQNGLMRSALTDPLASIESSFENSNHNIHSTQDTIYHPEFSFTHMKE
jgi:leucyl aminopeptidase